MAGGEEHYSMTTTSFPAAGMLARRPLLAMAGEYLMARGATLNESRFLA
jgi:hypothetical protein